MHASARRGARRSSTDSRDLGAANRREGDRRARRGDCRDDPTWSRVYLAIAGEDGHFRLHGRTDGLPDPHPRIDEGVLGRAMETAATSTKTPALARPARPEAGAAWRFPRHLGRTLGVDAFQSSRPAPSGPRTSISPRRWPRPSASRPRQGGPRRAREELTRMMVHDLRGPISGVMGALELLGRGPGLDDGNRGSSTPPRGTPAPAEASSRGSSSWPASRKAPSRRREQVSLAALVDDVLQTAMWPRRRAAWS